MPPKLIVGVGASAGGLQAFKELLSGLPRDAGIAYVLVQHLAPDHESLLPELLAPCTPLPVVSVDDGAPVEPDTVYVIRPDTMVSVQEGRLTVEEPRRRRGLRLPIDHVFRSLARASPSDGNGGGRVAGIVLSGAGSDGSAGLRELKAAGGLTVVQAPTTAIQEGMPRSAIATGAADLILDLDEIPAALTRFADLPAPAVDVNAAGGLADDDPSEAGPAASTALPESALIKLADILRDDPGFDLRNYKRNMVERRAVRRAALAGFDSIERYLDAIDQSPEERGRLVRDLLIGVTGFFRDRDAFQALRQRAIVPIVRQAERGSTIRVWVPGCATGEEAYSLAIEVMDEIRERHADLRLQIFATDIDKDALAVARAGVFPAAIAEEISPDRLGAYFEQLVGRGFRARPTLRDALSFSIHDLTKDPPFSRIHLVSCRNLLIYLTPACQRRVLQDLRFALRDNGVLFLGTSESTHASPSAFRTVSSSAKIFAPTGARHDRGSPHRAADPRDEIDWPSSLAGGAESSTDRPPPNEPERPRLPWGDERQVAHDATRKALVEAFVPPTVVVGVDGGILFTHGELGPFLRFPEGDAPRLELSRMLRPAVAVRARGVLYKVRRDQAPAEAKTEAEWPGPGDGVRILGRPAPRVGDEAVILSFETLHRTVDEPRPERPPAPEREDLVDRLEGELAATKRDLQDTIEQLELTNEELRSAHEESVSTNEELQSANEELESTTEELRSVNEELTTVNAQLREKIEQLEQANDDLENFLASANHPTLFLDDHERLRRITPAGMKLLDLDHTDHGRRVGDIRRELLEHGLEEDVRGMLDDFQPRTRTFQTAAGAWYHRTVLPYRTDDRRVAGAVVAYRDITEERDRQRLVEVNARRLELALQATGGGVFESALPIDGGAYYSDAWARVLGYEARELPAPEAIDDWLLARVDDQDRPALLRARRRFRDGEVRLHDAEFRIRHRDGSFRWVEEVAEATHRDEDDRATRIVGVMFDVTARREAEEQVRESEARFREITDALPLIVWVHDADGRQQQVNRTFCQFFGVSEEDMRGDQWQLLVHPDDRDGYNAAFAAAIEARTPFHAEARVKDGRGRWRWMESWGRPRTDSRGSFFGMVGASADVTERKEAERRLMDADRQKDRFLAMLGHELRNPLAAIQNAADLLDGPPEGEGTGGEELGHIREVLQRQSGHMATLIDGLLDVSRIVEGKVDLDRQPLDLTELCRDAVVDARQQAAHRSLSIGAVLPEGPVVAEGDRVRLAQVVGNLLSNSVKFTPDGGHIDLRLDASGGEAVISVVDDGVGIESGLLDTVFEIFRQGDVSLAREQGGLGVGLALVKSLTELHGGRVEAESDGPGRGAVFRIRLPLTDPISPESADGEPARASGDGPGKEAGNGERRSHLEILIVEDNIDAALMLQTLLSRKGHEVRIAEDGPSALSALNDALPDVVVCDLGLPGTMNGLDVARAIRAQTRTARLPLVALSGYGRAEDQEASAAAGFDAHFTKPIRADGLHESLVALVGQNSPRG